MVCVFAGSCLGLTENLKPRGSVAVCAKMLSHVEEPSSQNAAVVIDSILTDAPLLCLCVRACSSVFFRCLFLVTSSVFNTCV